MEICLNCPCLTEQSRYFFVESHTVSGSTSVTFSAVRHCKPACPHRNLATWICLCATIAVEKSMILDQYSFFMCECFTPWPAQCQLVLDGQSLEPAHQTTHAARIDLNRQLVQQETYMPCVPTAG